MNTPTEEQLDQALKSLPRSIEPEHDLWPGVAARIVTHQPQSWPRGILSYASAVAAVLVVTLSITWLVFGTHSLRSGDFADSTIVPVNQSQAGDSNALRAQFAAQLEANRQLPPKTRTALLENLRLLHDSILRTQAALRKYPNDVNLQALLINLYQQEARLTSEAQQAQIQTSTRNSI